MVLEVMKEYFDDEVDLLESEEESDDEEKFVVEVRRDVIYNIVVFYEKLEDIGWLDGVEWIYLLILEYEYDGFEIDVNDDLM